MCRACLRVLRASRFDVPYVPMCFMCSRALRVCVPLLRTYNCLRSLREFIFLRALRALIFFIFYILVLRAYFILHKLMNLLMIAHLCYY